MTGEELINFCDSYIALNERGKAWFLAQHQPAVIGKMWGADYSIRLWSERKKSGKTFLAACVAIAEAVSNADSEIVIYSNDLQQAIGRVFQTCVGLCKYNPQIAASATVQTAVIKFSNGSTIKAQSCDYRGEAGGRQRLSIFDELWGHNSESLQRLFEECTPAPTDPEAYILITSYAGFTCESELLESLYKRGLAGKRIDERLELYRADGLCMFWSHEPRQPWQLGAAAKKYYAEQKRILRPNTYLRLHENRWVSAESAFISAEQWDACVDPALSPLMADKNHMLFGAIDVGIKHDSSAVVLVRYDEQGKLAIANYRVWKPTRTEQVKVSDIEDYIIEMCQRYAVGALFADPSQFLNSIQTLAARGIFIQEFTQTTEGLTRAGQNLYDLIMGKNFRAYQSSELREHVLNAMALETPRGFRLVKSTAAKKIDAAIALAMASLRAIGEWKPWASWRRSSAWLRAASFRIAGGWQQLAR
jgi:phage terminase large subunit-like protein